MRAPLLQRARARVATRRSLPPLQAKNSEMLVECFYALEDFSGLSTLMDALSEGHALLRSIGEKFQSVGLCNEGVAAYLKVCSARAGWER